MADNAKKRHSAEKIWLHYFNRELYNQNLITLTQHSRIALKIESRKPPASNPRGQPPAGK